MNLSVVLFFVVAITVHFPPLYCSIEYPVALSFLAYSRVIHEPVVDATLKSDTPPRSVAAFIAVYSLNSVVLPVFLNDFILKE